MFAVIVALARCAMTKTGIIMHSTYTALGESSNVLGNSSRDKSESEDSGLHLDGVVKFVWTREPGKMVSELLNLYGGCVKCGDLRA